MSTVEQDYAAYLKADALYCVAEAADAAQWPSGRRVERTSAAATIAGATAEAARQMAFGGGAVVRDRATFAGRRRDLLGRAITLSHARLGYAGGVPAFVIGAQEVADGTTIVTVLKRLS